MPQVAWRQRGKRCAVIDQMRKQQEAWPGLGSRVICIQAVQSPVFRYDQDVRPAVAVDVGHDRFADAAAQRHGP